MKRKNIQHRPQQMDFWEDNVILVDFKRKYAYVLSPPLSNSERIINDWFIALKRKREQKVQ